MLDQVRTALGDLVAFIEANEPQLVAYGAYVSDEALRLMAERGVYFDPNIGLVLQNYIENKKRFLGIGNYTEDGFAFMEKTLDIRPNSSNLDVELGYFVSPRLRVFGMAAGHYSHDGIDLPVPPIARVTLTPEELIHHDQIVQEHFFNLGVGTSFSLTESLDLFGSYVKQMAGRNTHEVDRALSIGLSWRFKRGKTEDLSAVTAPPAPVGEQNARKSLVRCLCQKTAS